MILQNHMSEFSRKIKAFYPYLDDLNKRLRFVTFCFLIFFIAGFSLSGQTIKLLAKFFQIDNVILITNSPFQLVDLAMNIGVFFACAICTPIIIYQIYAFFKAGLRRQERSFFLFLLPLSIFLFLLGFTYGFFILYYAMEALARINVSLGIANMWNIATFLSQIVSTSALLGLIFQFPIVLTFLIKFNIISINLLKNKRPHAVFGMFIFTSLLPPTDGISLLLMVVPLILMYEITILYNRRHKTA